MTEHNPYATPSAQVRDVRRRQGFQKASRGKRLAATILDGLIGTLIWVVMIFGEEVAPGAAIAIGVLGMLGFFILQLVLFAQNGWTIGKKMLGIRIVRSSGDPCTLGRFIALRGIANGLLNIIPLYGLVDALFIFGEESRCVHDYIADTIVIDA